MLAETDSAANRTIQYVYDNAGNMLSRTICALDTGAEQDIRTYAYDCNNRIGTSETSPYSYVHDANGNMTQENENVSVTYTYDGYNRIKSINKPGLPFLEYEYNQENLRTAKIESDSIPASAKTVYGYDKDGNLVLEKNAYNASDKTVYLWEDTGNAAIMKRGGKAYSYVYDGMGRIHALHDCDEAENTFTYDVYGYTAYGEPLYTVGNVENPFRYASYYYDTDTGLYYLKNRYYAANKARFLTEDPYWNVSNMMYGKFTDTVEKRVYYPAVVQSGNRFAYCLNNPIGWYDPWGLVVTAWDKENCTVWEQVQLEKFTCLWEEGYQTNNEELMSYAHYQAEQIREKRREERGLGENGSDNGNTFAPTYLSPATNYISSSEEVDLIYGYTYGTDSFHSDAFYFVADGPEIENGVTLGSVETGMARIVGDFKYGGGALGIIGADAQASITRDFIGVESGVQLVSAEISIKIPIPFTNNSVVVGVEAEAFGIGATVALDLENKKFKVGITPIVGGKLIIGLD